MGGRRHLWALLGLGLLVALALGGYWIGEALERPAEEPRSVMTEGFGRYEEKIFHNETWYRKTGITTILLMGVDRDTTAQQQLFRNGGQSDFLMLLAVDHDAGTVRQLQIERDTVARIHVLTVLGQDGGYRNLQICLSHAYGANQEECAENAVEAVSHYLDNLDIDLFMAVDYSAVPAVNDLLGGVTVTLKDDFSRMDPEMVPGATLTLRGKQAEHFVRGRRTVGDGTNASRQLRQREWLDGATELLKQRMRQDSNFAGELMDTLGNSLVTNASRGQLINELSAALEYGISPVEQIPGEYSVNAGGFTEYHTAAEDVTRWVLDAFYRPAESEEKQKGKQEDA